MKKFTKIIISAIVVFTFLLLRSDVYAQYTEPWIATSTPGSNPIWTYPRLINGVPPTVLASSSAITYSSSTALTVSGLASTTDLIISRSAQIGSGDIVTDVGLNITRPDLDQTIWINQTLDAEGIATALKGIEIDPYLLYTTDNHGYYGILMNPVIGGSKYYDSVHPFSLNASTPLVSSFSGTVGHYGNEYGLIWRSGTLNNYIGLDIQQTKVSGTWGNATGLNIGDVPTATSTTFAIKTGLGKVSFGDKVGINTTNPLTNLEINNAGNPATLSLIGAGANSLYFGTVAGTPRGYMNYDTDNSEITLSSDGSLVGQSALQMQFTSLGGGVDFIANQNIGFGAGNPTPLTRMYILGSNGFVGIGTTTPRFSLSVHGAGGLYNGGNFFNAGTITSTSSSASTFPYASTTALTSTGSAFLATLGGSVGVATTSPFGLLSVEQGTETASLWVGNQGSSTPSLMVSGVNGNGRVGVGTSSPTTTFSVVGSGYITSGFGVGVLNTGAGTLKTSAGATIGTTLSVGTSATIGTSLGVTGTLTASGAIFAPSLTNSGGGIGFYAVCFNTNDTGSAGEIVYVSQDTCSGSSQRFKHDIRDLTISGLDSVLKLRPVSYSPNRDNSSDYRDVRFGFIAEEVADIDPHFAAYGTDGLPVTLDDRGILATVIKALQEIIAKVTGLEQKLNDQEARIQALEAKLK